MLKSAKQNAPLKTGLEFCGELLIPGGSNLVKGDWRQGALHAILGLTARAAFGIPGLLLVSANSISRAVTNHNLIDPGRRSATPAVAPVTEAVASVEENDAKALMSDTRDDAKPETHPSRKAVKKRPPAQSRRSK